MTGIVKAYDPQQFTGTIESDGNIFLVKRNSMRRGTILKVGDEVLFEGLNLSDGANAQQVRAVNGAVKDQKRKRDRMALPQKFNQKLIRKITMAKTTGITVTVSGTDKVNILYSSNGDQSLPVGAGVPVVATGNPKDKTATVHGQVTGTSVLIHNPA